MTAGPKMNKHEEILNAVASLLAQYQSDDNTSDGELLDMICELLEAVGLDPFGDVQTNFLNDLRRSAARWNAFRNGPEYVRRRVPFIACASCSSAGSDRDIMVDPMTAVCVPWDVMGDSRSFAFVCDGCASGSAVVL